MSTHKHIDLICVAVLLCTVLLTILFMNGDRFGLRPMVDEDTIQDPSSFTANDLDGNWETSTATKIRLQDGDIRVSGQGAYAFENDVIINNAGYFLLSGSLTNGRILVNAHSSSKVFLMLNGVDVACRDDACFQVLQAQKVFLTLAEDSENRLSSGITRYREALEDGRDGTLFTRDSLTINGNGNLNIDAAYRHGIEANDDLTIAGGTITIVCPQDGISVNDGLGIQQASLTVLAGDDGLRIKSHEIGAFYMKTGSLDITCGSDGIQAETTAEILDSSCAIRAGDTGIQAAGAVTITGGSLLLEGCKHDFQGEPIEQTDCEIVTFPGDSETLSAVPAQVPKMIPDPPPEPVESNPENPAEYPHGTWQRVILSILVLAAGLLAGFLFKKR